MWKSNFPDTFDYNFILFDEFCTPDKKQNTDATKKISANESDREMRNWICFSIFPSVFVSQLWSFVKSSPANYIELGHCETFTRHN
jgi:hypothetical protein